MSQRRTVGDWLGTEQPDDQWVEDWLAEPVSSFWDTDSLAELVDDLRPVEAFEAFRATGRIDLATTTVQDELEKLRRGDPSGYRSFRSRAGDADETLDWSMVPPRVEAALVARAVVEVLARMTRDELEAHSILGDPPADWSVGRLNEWLRERSGA